jgi:phospholipase C
MRNGALPLACVVLFAFAACSSSAGGSHSAGTNAFVPSVHKLGASASNPIQHVVIVVQENRSFDNLFDCFPGTECVTSAMEKTTPSSTPVPVSLQTGSNLVGYDIDHSYQPAFLSDYDNANMDGFSLAVFGGGNGPAGTYPYQVVAQSQITEYWTLAQQYALADRMFPTQASGSFTAHQDLIRGNTKINATDSLIDYPWNKYYISDWGCDDAKGTTTALLTDKGVYYGASPSPGYTPPGPFPCFKYKTIRDLLDAKHVSWKYYVPQWPKNGGQLWNAFDAVYAVRHDKHEWGKGGASGPSGVSMPETNIFNDINNNALPSVAWVVPSGPNSDHGYGGTLGQDNGPSWVASVVNAIGASPYWNSTAIVIVWDDWGGFYDHVPPPQIGDGGGGRWGGLGIRVPMIVVSPYAKQSYVSHTQYEFGSLLAFVEDTFALGRLGTTDGRANSISDCFNFSGKPRRFVKIKTAHSEQYFLHQPPSNQPVDTE